MVWRNPFLRKASAREEFYLLSNTSKMKEKLRKIRENRATVPSDPIYIYRRKRHRSFQNEIRLQRSSTKWSWAVLRVDFGAHN